MGVIRKYHTMYALGLSIVLLSITAAISQLNYDSGSESSVGKVQQKSQETNVAVLEDRLEQIRRDIAE